MIFGARRLFRGCGSAAFFMLTVLAMGDSAQAQSSLSQPQVSFDPKLFQWPTAPTYDLSNADPTRFQKWEPDKTIDQINLGTSLLRLNGIREADNFVPRASNDVSDLSDVVMPLRH